MNLQNQLDYDPTMFDGIILPSELDPDLVKSNIMLECGLLTPLYSEPSTMKAAIKVWFMSRQWEFEHLINIINAQYSPIENVDRYDSWTKDTTGTEDQTDTGTGSRTDKRTIDRDLDRETNTSGTNTNLGEVSAFNESSFQNSQQETFTTDIDGTEDVTENTKDNLTSNDTRTNTRDLDTTGHEAFTQHMHGNVGITSNQQLINQELDLLERFNIYQWIAKQFRINLILEVW